MKKPFEYLPVERSFIITGEGAEDVYVRSDQRCFTRQAFRTLPQRKHLSDAECAAEYWAVSHAVEVNMKHGDALEDLVAQQVREQYTWHRFATTPHAFGGDS